MARGSPHASRWRRSSGVTAVTKHLVYFRDAESDCLLELDLPRDFWDEEPAEAPYAAVAAWGARALRRATPSARRWSFGQFWSDGARWSAACVFATALAFFAGTYVNLGQRSAHAELMDEVIGYHRFFSNDRAH